MQPAKWTLLNLLETWFLTDDGQAVIVDPTAPGGATDDQWRELIARTGVQIPIEQIQAPWGQLSRRDFLNWCEGHITAERRPALFGSKKEAFMWQDFSKDFDESKRIEKSELA